MLTEEEKKKIAEEEKIRLKAKQNEEFKQSGIGCLALIGIVVLILVFSSFNCSKDNKKDNKLKVNGFSSDVNDILPEIRFFIEQNTMGTPIAVVANPDWAQGKRQSVRIVGRMETDDYLFYTQNDEVVTIYKLNSETTGERQEIYKKNN